MSVSTSRTLLITLLVLAGPPLACAAEDTTRILFINVRALPDQGSDLTTVLCPYRVHETLRIDRIPRGCRTGDESQGYDSNQEGTHRFTPSYP